MLVSISLQIPPYLWDKSIYKNVLISKDRRHGRHRPRERQAMHKDVAKFRQLLGTNPALRDKVRRAVVDFNGDRNNDRAVYEAVIAPIAASHGFDLTYEETFEPTMDTRELSDDELELIAGGASPVWQYLTSIC